MLAGPDTLTTDIMTRHPTARRVHRQSAEPDDAFVAGVLETSAWARENSRKIITGGIILALIIIGLIVFMTNRRQKEQQSVVELTQVRAVAMSGNAELAINDLRQFLDRFGGTRAADEARLLLAGAYLQAGQQQNAIGAVSGLADDVDTDIGVNAALLTAAAHEAAGNSTEAERVLARVAEDARFLFQRQDALDNIGRLRMQRGDVAGAVQTYERLLEITPVNAPERQVYELRLGEARARAAAGGGAQTPANTGATQPAGTTGG